MNPNYVGHRTANCNSTKHSTYLCHAEQSLLTIPAAVPESFL